MGTRAGMPKAHGFRILRTRKFSAIIRPVWPFVSNGTSSASASVAVETLNLLLRPFSERNSHKQVSLRLLEKGHEKKKEQEMRDHENGR